MGNLILASDFKMCQIAFGVSSKTHQTLLFYACHISLLPYIFCRTNFDQTHSHQQPQICFESVIQFYHCKLNGNRIKTFPAEMIHSLLLCVVFDHVDGKKI